jgi:uncharacterized membrane protein
MTEALKILHILSATLLLTTVFYCLHQWHSLRKIMSSPSIDVIHIHTWLIIIPLSIFQLVTGFMMISLKQEDLFSTWIIGSILCFIILIVSWFSFVYFLISSQYKRLQGIMLTISALSLLSMIFFMTSKIN